MEFDVVEGPYCIVVEEQDVSVLVRYPDVTYSDQVSSHYCAMMKCHLIFC